MAGPRAGNGVRPDVPAGPAGRDPRVIHANAPVDRDDEGRPLRVIGINGDVTEQSELERARIQAEVADEAKTRLLAQISLEIRTPAGAVFGNADELVDPHLTGAEAAAAVGAIRSDGQDPLCILDLAKVEAGKLENMDSII